MDGVQFVTSKPKYPVEPYSEPVFDIHNFNAWIRKALGRDSYDFHQHVQQGEHPNGYLYSVEAFDYSGDPSMSQYWQDTCDAIAEWLQTPAENYASYKDFPAIPVDEVFCYLVHKGLWPEGNFYIHVWW